MTANTGIEHAQITQIAHLFADPTSFDPGSGLTQPTRSTPNQTLLAAALALGQSRLNPSTHDRVAATSQALAVFQAMETYGHQKTMAGTYSNEQGAPDPHSGLWKAAAATCLRESLLLGTDELTDAVLRYWAAHVVLSVAFWTPLGIRTPCARAKPAPGRPLAPNWTVDSYCTATIMGGSLAGLPRPTPDDLPIRILKDSADVFPRLRSLVDTVRPILGVPIRKWVAPSGGFIAAMVRDEPMNDRLSWIEVDSFGTILRADATLSTLNLPPWADNATVIGEGSTSGTEGGGRPIDALPPPPVDVGTPPDASGNPTLSIPNWDLARQLLDKLVLGNPAKPYRQAARVAIQSRNQAASTHNVNMILLHINPGQFPDVDKILTALTGES